MTDAGDKRERAVAFGRVQRALLREAAIGPTKLSKPGTREAVSKGRHEAAAALVRLGLARTYISADRGGAKLMELTPNGHALVHDFADELKHGKRIRWAQKGWWASYAPIDDAPRPAPVPVPANDVASPHAPRIASRVWGTLATAAITLLMRRAA